MLASDLFGIATCCRLPAARCCGYRFAWNILLLMCMQLARVGDIEAKRRG